ncbi:MAG: SLBB domain-containing protein [Ignavibacteriaceae bacterium]
MKVYLFFISLLVFGVQNFAQSNDTKIGIDYGNLRQYTQGGYYDYSDPQSVNIKVAVWGNVRFPGRYIVPEYTNAKDLLSYAGGPTDAALLEDLRIFRMKEDSTQEFISFNYNDLLWSKEPKKVPAPPQIKAGDVLLAPGEPRWYTRDYLSISLSVVSTLISLSILILNIVRK